MSIREQGWCPHCQQITVQEIKRESRYIVIVCTKCDALLAKTRPKRVKRGLHGEAKLD